MASRQTIVLQDKVRKLHERNDVTMDSLFSEIDRDGNGSISKEEFSRVFNAIRDSVEEEHEKLARSKRKSAILCTAVAMLVAFLGILLAGNTGLVWWMIRLNKDTAIGTSGSQIALTSLDGRVIETGVAKKSSDMASLPNGTFESFNRLDMVTYPDLSSVVASGSARRTRASRVSTWDWQSHERMTVSLEDGTIILISGQNVLFSAPPVAAVTYDAASSVLRMVGLSGQHSATTSAALVAQATSKCADLGCGVSSCGAAVSLVSGVPSINSVTCGAHKVWKWPAGVTQADAAALAAASADVMVESETETDIVGRRMQGCGTKRTFTRPASGGCKGWTCTNTMCGGMSCKCTGGWNLWAVIFR